MKNISIKIQLSSIVFMFILFSIGGIIYFQYSVSSIKKMGMSEFFLSQVNKDILLLTDVTIR